MLPMAPLTDGVPDMTGQLGLAARVGRLSFAARWSRDVPLFDPNFGDAGQIYDPWVWLGALAAITTDITLSTAGIVLPLRLPLHTAKAAASIDALSGGRFMLGVASGDRASEYPAFGVAHETRGAAFREAIEVISRTTSEAYPVLGGAFGRLEGLDLLPKAPSGHLPLLAIGSAQQSVQWIAEHMDGWVTYPRDVEDQRKRIDLWKSAVAQRANGAFRPFAQSLFIDLTDDPMTEPSPIFLGFRLGRVHLIDHLETLRSLGVGHVAFNLRHSLRPAAEVIEELAADVLPQFPTLATAHLRAVA
jgi:luciferase-type oxidoreductase